MQHASDHKLPEWDYIVVGGGSAGCAAAARLAQPIGAKVLLIEAGDNDRSPFIHIPAGVMRIMRNPRFDWLYQTEPDPSINGRTGRWSGGKVLGGSSSINGMVFVRGLVGDFERWVDAGAAGWHFQDILPFFKRLENWEGIPNPSRGTDGPIRTAPSYVHPLAHDVTAAAAALGYPVLADINAAAREGFGLTQTNISKGWRMSAARGYLRGLPRGGVLCVETSAFAERLIFRGRRCEGIVYRKGNQTITARAGGEVIVCAGAIASPALLQRSGVGPATTLSKLGIEVVQDSPGVGTNLQEHGAIAVGFASLVPTVNMEGRGWRAVRSGLQWLVGRSGPIAMSVVHVSGFVRTRADLDAPDVQLQFVPLAYDDSGDQPRMAGHAQIGFTINPCRPKSRGNISIKSADPSVPPVIAHHLFGASEDIEAIARGGDVVRRLAATAPLRGKLGAELFPGPQVTSVADWEAYVRSASFIQSHPCGTCRMGRDDAVLDPQLRVRGTAGLRVADASVMPTILSSNTNAASMMIGERVADFILRGRP